MLACTAVAGCGNTAYVQSPSQPHTFLSCVSADNGTPKDSQLLLVHQSELTLGLTRLRPQSQATLPSLG